MIAVALDDLRIVISASTSSLVTVHVADSPGANVTVSPCCVPPSQLKSVATYPGTSVSDTVYRPGLTGASVIDVSPVTPLIRVGPSAVKVQSVGCAVPPLSLITTFTRVSSEMIGNGWTSVQSASVEPSGQFVPGEVTVAVLTTVPSGVTEPAGNGSAASVTMSKEMSAPAASVAAVQVTTASAASAVQPSGEDTKVRPAGRGSVTTTLVASTGPVLVTVNVYGTWLPGTICVTDDDFTIESCGWTGNGTVDSHSGPPLPSGGQLVLGAVTVAVLGTFPVGSIGVGRERIRGVGDDVDRHGCAGREVTERTGHCHPVR